MRANAPRIGSAWPQVAQKGRGHDRRVAVIAFDMLRHTLFINYQVPPSANASPENRVDVVGVRDVGGDLSG